MRNLDNPGHIAMTHDMEEEVSELCNLGQGIYDKGYGNALSANKKDTVCRMLKKERYDYGEIAEIADVTIEYVEDMAKEIFALV